MEIKSSSWVAHCSSVPLLLNQVGGLESSETSHILIPSAAYNSSYFPSINTECLRHQTWFLALQVQPQTENSNLALGEFLFLAGKGWGGWGMMPNNKQGEQSVSVDR